MGAASGPQPAPPSNTQESPPPQGPWPAGDGSGSAPDSELPTDAQVPEQQERPAAVEPSPVVTSPTASGQPEAPAATPKSMPGNAPRTPKP